MKLKSETEYDVLMHTYNRIIEKQMEKQMNE